MIKKSATADKENIAMGLKTDTVNMEINHLKTKFIRFTNRYFFHKRNLSNRENRERFSSGTPGYAIYKSAMRTFNTMHREFASPIKDMFSDIDSS